MSTYQVLFNGVIAEGEDPKKVSRAVAGELGIDLGKARRLFTGRTVVLASQRSRDAALELQARLESLGAIARIKDLGPRREMPPDYERTKTDGTLRDLTAAHIDCPRCSHIQLESSHCARCGIDIEAQFRKRRKEEMLMQKQLRAHREAVASKREPALESAADPVQTEPKRGFLARLFRRSR